MLCRVCVIVNDMASLNIDASVIKNSKLVQTEERLVEMQNGCICCTLREDLVVEVGALARSGKFDYLVVESTGIGEPQQTAETFTMQLSDEHGEVPLSDIARLDTCVTVVDAAELLSNAASVESLAQRGEAATDEDDRNVADLLLDQLEFADVILLNKTDLVSKEEVKRLIAFIKTLNPDAEIIPTVQSEVDLSRVIHTGRFSFEKAARSAGWLQSLQADAVHTPETLEYGIGHFIYRARKPVHPGRLYEFMTNHFLLQEPDWREAMGIEDIGSGGKKEDNGLVNGDLMQTAQNSATAAAAAAQQTTEALNQLKINIGTSKSSPNEGGGVEGKAESQAPLLAAAVAAAAAAAAASSAVAILLTQLPLHEEISHLAVDTHAGCNHTTEHSHNGDHHESHSHQQQPLSPQDAAAAAARRQRLQSSFGQVLRAKGFTWLASRDDLCGEWSQAGGVLRFTVGGPWYATLPDEAWPQDPAERAEIMRDFQGETGDRRQELVFIGIDINQEALTKALDDCLLKESEEIGSDPFAIWPPLDQILDGGDDEDEEEDEEESISEEESEEDEESFSEEESENESEDGVISVLPPPGKVLSITEGAWEVQELFNALPSGTLALVQWHAEWVGPSTAACTALDTLAVQYPKAVILRVDVDVSFGNRTLAMEKVMERAHARREGAKPILRMGARFPAISVHYAPNLQPSQLLTGDGALQKAATLLADNYGEGSLDPRLQAEAESRGEGGVSSSVLRNRPNAVVARNGDGVVNKLITGAAQFKAFLVADRDAGRDSMILWNSSDFDPSLVGFARAAEVSKQKDLQSAAMEVAATHRIGVILADVAISSSNKILANALGLKAFPAVHIYRGMKLDKKLIGSEEVTPASILVTASTGQSSRKSNATAAAAAAPVAAPLAAASSTTAAGAAVSTSSQKQNHIPSEYDPPTGKFARRGATKSMADGRTGHFFPKMPCLKCGCPWWSSDDWNARCLRCGWSCEREGYDDDSKPLPGFVKKWEMFTSAIKEGKTPIWKGK